MEPLIELGSTAVKRRVSYFYDSDIGCFHYADGHPMKPHRIRMTHNIIMNYGLYKHMEIYRAKPATKTEMSQFHSDEYVDFLARVTPDNMERYAREQARFNVGDDCPVFNGLFDYCSISAGGSMEGAARLNRERCDIAINWAGGLHHAKKSEASGFCYVNDIVLGILELLRFHPRVLYIDIDIHHGDGVEEAFYSTDRVMTLSFHRYGEFFPGTGNISDTGYKKGKGYSVNVPLRDGMDDTTFTAMFRPIVASCVDHYQPSAIVLQCGADSLAGDRLGSWNLSMTGHASCVEYVKTFNLPLLLLGGGGYTIRNVSRTWAFETGLACGVQLRRRLVHNDYWDYFGPEWLLDVAATNMENLNTELYLEKVKIQIMEQLRSLKGGHAPGVQMQPVPPDPLQAEPPEPNPDVRHHRNDTDARIEQPSEHYTKLDIKERNHETHGPASGDPSHANPLNSHMIHQSDGAPKGELAGLANASEVANQPGNARQMPTIAGVDTADMQTD